MDTNGTIITNPKNMASMLRHKAAAETLEGILEGAAQLGQDTVRVEDLRATAETFRKRYEDERAQYDIEKNAVRAARHVIRF